MTPADFEHLERELGLVLPEPYRQAMLAFPFPLGSYATDLWLVSDPRIVLEDNRQVRDTDLKGRPWPPQHLIIGGDGGEELFVMDCAQPSGAVLVFEVESQRTRPYAATFADFLANLRDDLRESEESLLAMAEAYRNKKWWQFWIPPYPPRHAS